VIVIKRAIKTHITPLVPHTDRDKTAKVTTYTVLRIKANIEKVLVVHEALEKIQHATCLREYDSSMTSGLQLGHNGRQLQQLAYNCHNISLAVNRHVRESDK